MKKLSHLSKLCVAGLIMALTLLVSSDAFAKQPQSQQECDAAGGSWVKNQLTGEFKCELPPSEPSNPNGPNPPVPPTLSLVLLWNGSALDKHNSLHLSVGSNIGSRLGLDVTNDGDRAQPLGTQVLLGLFGQDPPVLRFTLKTITLPVIAAGQTFQDRNLGPVVLSSTVPAGTYNLCARLPNSKLDCFPIQLELTAHTPGPQ